MAVLLAQKHNVTALDINKDRVDSINNKVSTIVDSDISEFLKNPSLNIEATCNQQAAYENADFIIIATQTDYDPETDKKGIAQINVAKQRNGAIGKFNLTWVGRYTKFENWVPEYEQF